MRNKAKHFIGKAVIKLGQHAVGKSMSPGMFDPKIPQQLKDEIKCKTQKVSCSDMTESKS